MLRNFFRKWREFYCFCCWTQEWKCHPK